MSIAKIIELSAESPKNFEDAILGASDRTEGHSHCHDHHGHYSDSHMVPPGY